MSGPPSPDDALRARISAIHREIAAIDLVARGTLVRRTKVCGKPGCQCARDPQARHGPYYEWGRLERGRRTSTTISPQKARRLAAALRNQRRLRTLLQRWERESMRSIDATTDVTQDKHKG